MSLYDFRWSRGIKAATTLDLHAMARADVLRL
jgi:hypothetical protein